MRINKDYRPESKGRAEFASDPERRDSGASKQNGLGWMTDRRGQFRYKSRLTRVNGSITG